MYLAQIHVTYKESVVDPQGQAIKAAAHRAGHTGVKDLAIGKQIELTLDVPADQVEAEVEALCDSLLTNPNVEDYTYTITEVPAQ